MIELDQIREALNQMQTPMLSLYLSVDNARPENQAQTPAWEIERKNALGQVESDVMMADNRQQWQRIQEQVEAFFTDYLPSGRSLTIFADGETLKSYELPVPLASQAHFGEALALPLLWAIDEYERYLIVQVDSEQVRFISGYLGSASAAGEMQIELDAYDFRQKRMMPANNSLQATGGNNHDAYDKTIDAHVQRFYRDIAERVRELADEMGAERVILSGDEQAAHLLQEQFDAATTKMIVGVAPAPLSLSEDEVLARVLDTALAYEREYEEELVGTIINSAKAGGRGALGAPDVIEALTQNRVEMLVLPYPPRENDIANDLKQRAFQQGTKIELVHGDPADRLSEEGGVGARLYYAIET